MAILGSALRAELIDALGISALRNEFRSELRGITAELKRLRRLVGARAKPARTAATGAVEGVSSEDIRRVRARFQETRKAFAARLGVSPGIVFMWESGRSTPRRAAIVTRLRRLIADSGDGKTSNATGADQTRRKLKLSPKRQAALKIQGKYLGYMKKLNPKGRAQVKAVKAERGYPAALALAKRLIA